jgi:trehalose 6-phosphate phosphatase
METILADEQRLLLTSFAYSNLLLAFDYDGTLAPIAPAPERAVMRRVTRQLLTVVARLYPCVVISGRALDDLVERFRGVPVWYLFGNHGLEPPAPGTSSPTPAREWALELKRHLPDDPGIVIEDKRYSLTIHYRQARDRHAAVEAIDRAVAHLPDARALGGAEAVSLLPRGVGDKGVALRQACRWFACDSAIYVGDDATDEDAFASTYPERLLAIKVGAAEQSRAQHHLSSQHDIDALLRLLMEFRGVRSADTGRSSDD